MSNSEINNAGSSAKNSAKNPAENDGAEDDPFKRPPSAVAIQLRTLRSAVLRAVNSRERVPHPLFWSLFLTEVSQLKRRKHEQRVVDQLLQGIETE
jgi:hypothetical protein